MSIYTTRTITRSEAIRMWLAKKEVCFTNEQLGDILDGLYSEKTLYNYLVVDDKSYEGDNE